MKVRCMDECRHSKDGYCTLDSIFLFDKECKDYEECTDEELHPDVFYMRTADNKWQETRGKKVELFGREMFRRYDSYTDGRTGVLACYEFSITELENHKDKVIKKCEEFEKKYGVSPLYR